MGRLFTLAAPLLFLLLAVAGGTSAAPTNMAADTVYRNGRIYTADPMNHFREAIAFRDGRVVYVGSSAGTRRYVGAATRAVDLKGRFAMPGLVDGHMHPLEGGQGLLKCNLDYERLTVPQLQLRLQACLDASRNHEPDGWLEVVNWFQQGMLPAGVPIKSTTIDALRTQRPILVRDAFGHTALANTRAVALAGITHATPDPLGGRINRNAAGEATGLLEDAAQRVCEDLIPAPTAAQDVAAVRAALAALAAAGVTSALDADSKPPNMAAFAAVDRAGGLTARIHLAVHIEPTEGADPAAAVSRVLAAHRNFDRGAPLPTPHLTVRNAKMFLDGVISGPAFTGAMLEPYLVDAGVEATPRWVPGSGRGPAVYYPAPVLADILVRLARVGIDPHMHADGDLAVRAGLDAVAAMRRAVPRADIRPALAHDEIVARADYPRFKALGTYPVLSLQWGKPAPDTVEQLRDYLGAERAAILEPAGLLLAAGAQVAFGSDWPVDALDEWFALKVAVTRTNSPASGYSGRLGADPGLTRLQALRAATIVAAYELHAERVTGSLQVGKFADLIVLDRDPLSIPAEDIANVRVLETTVGGRVVYTAPGAAF